MVDANHGAPATAIGRERVWPTSQRASDRLAPQPGVVHSPPNLPFGPPFLIRGWLAVCGLSGLEEGRAGSRYTFGRRLFRCTATQNRPSLLPDDSSACSKRIEKEERRVVYKLMWGETGRPLPPGATIPLVQYVVKSPTIARPGYHHCSSLQLVTNFSTANLV